MTATATLICTDATEETTLRGNLSTVTEALAFMNAGKATFTLRSVTTGTRFTYKIRTKENIQFVSLLNGADNENSYVYIGYIRRGVYFHGGEKSRVTASAPSNLGFAWVWKHLARNVMPSTVEIWHEGRCGRCGRKLTVPESVSSGFGPECITRV